MVFVIVLSAVACAKELNHPDLCEQWLIEAGKTLAVAPEKRFKHGLMKIQQGCGNLIPDILRKAAGEALSVSRSSGRFKIFTRAAATYYRSACFEILPGKPAEDLFDFCLEGDYPDGNYSGILHSIDAADYLFLKAVEKELSKNIAKTSESKFYAQKFMQNLFLAAALDYEKEHSR
jgi:hypothetical protein